MGGATLHAEAALLEGVISLAPDAAQAFSDALTQPAVVNERLAAALDRPRSFQWCPEPCPQLGNSDLGEADPAGRTRAGAADITSPA
jgi:hypothetical protein